MSESVRSNKEVQMEKLGMIPVLLAFLFFINGCSGYSGVTSASKAPQTKTADVNKDGKPDVTYYSDGKYAAKIEADTNFDGKPDVVVHTKDGKFESAEADTNYDGKPDKKFTDAKAFNKWLNDSHSDFNDKLNRSDWDFAMIRF